MDFVAEQGIEIHILNIKKAIVSHPNLFSIAGDARDLHQIKDHEFDIVFSNSVIEHVGTFSNQAQMANEVKRVGKRYFLQTPNQYFPIEPHFCVPFFQFFPNWTKVMLHSNFNLGWYEKVPNRKKAQDNVNSIQLLNKKRLKRLFPDAMLYEEKFFGLTKSFIVYKGF